MSTEECPNFGAHKYYMVGKSYTDFVLAGVEKEPGVPLYQRNEYAVLSCQCGSVQRRLVEDR